MQVLGPNMPCLLRIYDFMIFLYQFIYLPLIPHDDKPILLVEINEIVMSSFFTI